MRVTNLVSKKEMPTRAPPRAGSDPTLRDSPDVGRAAAGSLGATAESANGGAGLARLVGLSSPDPRHPRFTAISWVVLQEVKHDAAMALLRLELLRRQHPEPAIARATEFLRCAVGELDALAAGDSDGS
jgi:hypothetical protein